MFRTNSEWLHWQAESVIRVWVSSQWHHQAYISFVLIEHGDRHPMKLYFIIFVPGVLGKKLFGVTRYWFSTTRIRHQRLFTNKISPSLYIFHWAGWLCLTSSLVYKQLFTTGDTQGVQTCLYIFFFTSLTLDTLWQKIHQKNSRATCMWSMSFKQVAPPI